MDARRLLTVNRSYLMRVGGHVIGLLSAAQSPTKDRTDPSYPRPLDVIR